MQQFDVVVVGAGAAGLYAAGIAGQRGLRVLLLDHAQRLAEKIRISGGGRCNFTNRDAGPGNFLSENPHFCRSALARHRPADFIALLDRDRVGWHEKHRGQLFCDESSEDVIGLLLRECESGGVVRRQPCAVHAVRGLRHGFELDTDGGPVAAAQLVVATGGLSIPKIGASDWGLRLARQFGHRVVEPRPALVPLTFDAADWAPYAALAGVSLEVRARAGELPTGRKRQVEGEFLEDLLFTHRGLSGPAILQISSFWRPGEPVVLDLAPGVDLGLVLREAKSGSRRHLVNELGTHLPARLAEAWCARLGAASAKPIADLPDRILLDLAASLQRWRLVPSGSEGWRKAEVMAGGVDTRELSSQTLESQRQPGLHFIGEVVDVTGWLGGYNFQWAWSSAYACAQALRPAAAFA